MSPPQHLLIVGGGIQGSAVAYFASKQSTKATPTRITIVEANDTLAPHASGKGGGFLARSWGDGSPTQALHHVSFDLHEQLAKDLPLTSYRKLPCLSVSNGGKTFKAPSGVTLPSWLDGKGGSLTSLAAPGETAQVTPRELTERLAEESGATLVLGKIVIKVLTKESDGQLEVWGVKLHDGSTIECDVSEGREV
jgi:hypothetical protein